MRGAEGGDTAGVSVVGRDRVYLNTLGLAVPSGRLGSSGGHPAVPGGLRVGLGVLGDSACHTGPKQARTVAKLESTWTISAEP